MQGVCQVKWPGRLGVGQQMWVFLPQCRVPRWGAVVVPHSLPLFLLSLQTAQAARRRSSKASPSWPLRSSGTSAASSAKHVGSSSPASTSASECHCPGSRFGHAGCCLAVPPLPELGLQRGVCPVWLTRHSPLSPPSPKGMASRTASLTTMPNLASSVRPATGTSAAGS